MLIIIFLHSYNISCHVRLYYPGPELMPFPIKYGHGRVLPGQALIYSDPYIEGPELLGFSEEEHAVPSSDLLVRYKREEYRPPGKSVVKCCHFSVTDMGSGVILCDPKVGLYSNRLHRHRNHASRPLYHAACTLKLYNKYFLLGST